MRIKYKLLVLAIAGAISGATFASLPPVRDQISCRLGLGEVRPYKIEWMSVPVEKQERFSNALRELSVARGWIFAHDIFPAGAAGIMHVRHVMEICDRFMDINIINGSEPDRFSINFSRSSDFNETDAELRITEILSYVRERLR